MRRLSSCYAAKIYREDAPRWRVVQGRERCTREVNEAHESVSIEGIKSHLISAGCFYTSGGLNFKNLFKKLRVLLQFRLTVTTLMMSTPLAPAGLVLRV